MFYFITPTLYDSVFRTASHDQEKAGRQKGREGRRKNNRIENISISRVGRFSIVCGNFVIHSRRSVSVLYQDSNVFLAVVYV